MFNEPLIHVRHFDTSNITLNPCKNPESLPENSPTRPGENVWSSCLRTPEDKWQPGSWGRRPEFEASLCGHHFLGGGGHILEPGSGHWCERSPRRNPLHVAQEQERKLLKLRDDVEVTPPPELSIFLHPAIHGSGCRGCNSTGPRTMRKGSLPLQLVELWSQEGGENPDACYFFPSFSVPNLLPLGPIEGKWGN